MSTEQERPSALDAGDVDAYETRLIDLLYELEEEGRVVNFYIGEDGTGHNEDEELANAERIDILCETLGIEPNKLGATFIAGWLKNNHGTTSLSFQEARRVQRHGIGVGKFMVHLAWEALPVERDEHGGGKAELSLRCGDDNMLYIESDGSFETIYPPLDSDEDSVMSFRVDYKASVLPVDQREL